MMRESWIRSAAMVFMLLSLSKVTSAESNCAKSTLCQTQSAILVQFLLDDFSRNIVGYREAHDGELPGSPSEFRQFVMARHESDPTRHALRSVDAFDTPGAFTFWYTLARGEDWTATAIPTISQSYEFRATADGKFFVRTDGGIWQTMPPVLLARIEFWEARMDELWDAHLGSQPSLDDRGQVHELEGLALLQSIAVARPEAAKPLLDEDGFIDPAKVYSRDPILARGAVEPLFNMEVRPTPTDGWQVVIWPKNYSPDTRFTYCQDDQGNVRVGDVGGSDDCSTVPCF